jgi:uncharacterized protein YqhQ
VIEGVMMRAPGAWSVAVRQPDDSIVARRDELERLSNRNRAARIPLVRGIVVLWESLSLGFRALSWSAEKAAGEEEEPLTKAQIGWTMALAMALFAGLFILLRDPVQRDRGPAPSRPVHRLYLGHRALG